MIDRLLKNWKTSVLGVVILLMGGILVFFEKATLTEATPFLVGVFGLLYKSSSKEEKK